MRIAPAITLSGEERATLTKWSRGRKTPARLVQHAQIVLRAAANLENKDIAVELGCTRHTIGTWRNQFAVERLPGIEQDPAVPHALHTDVEFLAEPDRALVPRPAPAATTSRRLPQRRRTDARDRNSQVREKRPDRRATRCGTKGESPF